MATVTGRPLTYTARLREIVLRSLQVQKKADAKQTKAGPSLSGWWWAPLLTLYWLVDDPIHLHLTDLLNQADLRSPEEESLSRMLHALDDLVSWTFDEPDDLYDSLWDSNLEWISAENQGEALLLLGFITELLWRRDVVKMQDRWDALLSRWISNLQQKPEAFSVTQTLQHLLTRLKVQSKVVWPGIGGKEPANIREVLSETELGLYAAWQAWLQRDWNSLDQILAEVTPCVPGGAAYDLAAYRLHHASRILRQKTGDPQGIGIARIRTRSGFHSYRTQVLKEAVSAAWGEAEPGPAHERFHAFRLAHLCQIAALRSWNLIGWLQASQAIASANLEITRHGEADSWFAAEALWWGVVSLSLSESNQAVRKAVYRLDRADEEHRRRLVKALINTRPIEYDNAALLVDLLSDAIPTDLLPEVAEWYVNHSQLPEKGFVRKVFPLSVWADILPFLDHGMAERLCEILNPAVLRFASIRAVWLTDSSSKSMLTHYLRCAPLSLAMEAIDKMLSWDKVDEHERDARWTLIYNAATRRRELRERFKDSLISQTSRPHMKFHAQFLDDPNLPPDKAEDAELREWCKQRIAAFAEIVLARKPDSLNGPAGAVSANLIGKVSWRAEDADIISKLIRMIVEASNVSVLEHVSGIQYIAQMVSRGPEALAQRVTQSLMSWLAKEPTGRSEFPANWKGPLSIAQAKGVDSEDVTAAVAFLGTEMVCKGLEDVKEPLAKWVTEKCYSCGPKTWREMVLLAMTLAKQTENPLGLQTATAAQIVFCRAVEYSLTSGDTDSHLHSMLDQIGAFMDRKAALLNLYFATNEAAREAFLTCLRGVIPVIASYPDPDVRSAAARIIRLWKEHGDMPAELEATFTRFQQDARARVRYETMIQEG